MLSEKKTLAKIEIYKGVDQGNLNTIMQNITSARGNS